MNNTDGRLFNSPTQLQLDKAYVVISPDMHNKDRKTVLIIPWKKHDGHYFKFCIRSSTVLKQFRKYVGLCQTFLQVPQGRSDKTIKLSKTIV